MAFDDPIGVEPRALKLAVDVGGVNEGINRSRFAPTLQDGKAFVRSSGPIQVETMSVKPPGKLGIVVKPSRTSQLGEAETEFFIERIGVPETLVSSKVGQA